MTVAGVELSWRDRVGPEDESQVEQLVSSTGFFSSEEVAIAVELVHESLERGEASGYSFVLADGPEGLDGYACYGRTPGTAYSWDLYWIVVAPRVQRTGLGSRLLAEVERRIRRTGRASIWVDTSGRALYRPTWAFYRRQGFREAARLEDFYDSGDDKLILVKRLSGSSIVEAKELRAQGQPVPSSSGKRGFGEI